MFQFLSLFRNRDSIVNWTIGATRGNFAAFPALVPPNDDLWQINKRFERFGSITPLGNGHVEADAVAKPDFQGVDLPFVSSRNRLTL